MFNAGQCNSKKFSICQYFSCNLPLGNNRDNVNFVLVSSYLTASVTLWTKGNNEKRHKICEIEFDLWLCVRFVRKLILVWRSPTQMTHLSITFQHFQKYGLCVFAIKQEHTRKLASWTTKLYFHFSLGDWFVIKIIFVLWFNLFGASLWLVKTFSIKEQKKISNESTSNMFFFFFRIIESVTRLSNK